MTYFNTQTVNIYDNYVTHLYNFDTEQCKGIFLK